MTIPTMAHHIVVVFHNRKAYPAYIDLLRDLRTVCVFIACNSALANVLPNAKRFNRWPKVKYAYTWLVDMVAACALNWRICLPSLDHEFMGFRNTVRYRYRTWQQHRTDQKQL